MSTENETSQKVSNDELLNDIAITGRELEAYQKISNGFFVLASIPENIQSGKSSDYLFQARRYSSLENDCAEFLRKLHAIKAERGL